MRNPDRHSHSCQCHDLHLHRQHNRHVLLKSPLQSEGIRDLLRRDESPWKHVSRFGSRELTEKEKGVVYILSLFSNTRGVVFVCNVKMTGGGGNTFKWAFFYWMICRVKQSTVYSAPNPRKTANIKPNNLLECRLQLECHYNQVNTEEKHSLS